MSSGIKSYYTHIHQQHSLALTDCVEIGHAGALWIRGGCLIIEYLRAGAYRPLTQVAMHLSCHLF